MARPCASDLLGSLSPKREAFVREYLIDLNATQAAIRAGYSRKSAASQADQILRVPQVAAAVRAAMDERARRAEITADRVLQEVAKLAFLDIGGAFNPDGTLRALTEIEPDVRAGIAGLEVSEHTGAAGTPVSRFKKLRLTEKTAALQLLMRHLGLLNDKLKLQGDADNPLALLIRDIQGSAVKPVAQKDERS